MPGIAVKLPVSRDQRDGIRLVKNYRDLARQNLKMLMLTAPGERMMEPEFGVGVKNFLFEPLTETTQERLRSRILEQQQRYLPYIVIRNVEFASALNTPNVDENFLAVKITYYNKALKTADSLALPIS
jgi:phage baseplate assembly protein W|tara:strand:+ start:377 stop:760 length:384 start_codon:yes stop_codon:yes gene_type:complete